MLCIVIDNTIHLGKKKIGLLIKNLLIKMFLKKELAGLARHYEHFNLILNIFDFTILVEIFAMIDSTITEH